jgi:hypothetical protein
MIEIFATLLTPSRISDILQTRKIIRYSERALKIAGEFSNFDPAIP